MIAEARLDVDSSEFSRKVDETTAGDAVPNPPGRHGEGAADVLDGVPPETPWDRRSPSPSLAPHLRSGRNPSEGPGDYRYGGRSSEPAVIKLVCMCAISRHWHRGSS